MVKRELTWAEIAGPGGRSCRAAPTEHFNHEMLLLYGNFIGRYMFTY
jgi:hypothetical protein